MAKFITLENLSRFKKNVDNIIPTKTSELENDSDFAVKTEIPDISNLADKSEIPTKVSELENDSGFITENEIPTDYAKQSEIPTKTSELTNDSNFITQADIPDVSNFATKSDIPDVSNLASKDELPTKTSELENDSNFATKDELPNLDDFDLSEYAKKTEIPNISNLASKDELPTKTSELTNDSNFITQADIPDVSNFATKSDIPDVSNLASKDELPTKTSELTNDSNFATKSEIPDVSNLASKDEIPTKTSELTNDSNFVTKAEIPDVSNLASKDEIPDVSNLASKDEIPDVSNLASKDDIPTKTSELTNDSNFATKSEIPDISNLATETFVRNEIANAQLSGDDVEIDLSGYATKDDLNLKADKTEIPSIEGLASETFVNNAVSDKATTSYVDSKAQTALSDSKSYTDGKIDAIVGEGASETLDTIGEISKAIEENESVVDALNDAIGSKANQSDLNTTNSNVSDLASTVDSLETNKADKSSLNNYLPLTAGSTKKLTNALYLPTSTDTWGGSKGINFGSTSINIGVNNSYGVMGFKVPTAFHFRVNGVTNTIIANDFIRPNSDNTMDLGLASSQWKNIYGKTLYQDGKQVANKEEIPTKTSTLTNDSGFATETYVKNEIANAQLGGEGGDIDLSGYATKDELNLKADKTEIPSIAGLASETYVNNAVSSKADKSEIPDVSNLASKDEIPDVSNLASKDEIPDVSNLASKDEIPTKTSELTNDSNFVTKAEIPDVSNLASKDEIPDVSNLASKDEIPDVSNLASKDEIPSVDGLATETFVNNAVSDKATTTYVDTQLESKANQSVVDSITTAYLKTAAKGNQTDISTGEVFQGLTITSQDNTQYGQYFSSDDFSVVTSGPLPNIYRLFNLKDVVRTTGTDQNISGIKNFIGTLQKNGSEVLVESDLATVALSGLVTDLIGWQDLVYCYDASAGSDGYIIFKNKFCITWGNDSVSTWPCGNFTHKPALVYGNDYSGNTYMPTCTVSATGVEWKNLGSRVGSWVVFGFLENFPNID